LKFYIAVLVGDRLEIIVKSQKSQESVRGERGAVVLRADAAEPRWEAEWGEWRNSHGSDFQREDSAGPFKSLIMPSAHCAQSSVIHPVTEC
jgi:hypothetical protein